METQTYLSTKEVAALLGVSYFRVWYAAHKSRIKPLKVGRASLFTLAEIMELRRLFCQREGK